MEIRTLGALSVADASEVAQARRFAMGLARGLGFNEAEIGKVALVVTEAATNLLKHARDGEIVFNALRDRERSGISVLAMDRGPGIKDLGRSLQDGYSTAGSPGTGLGAIRRLASVFDIYSVPGAGTALLVRIWPDSKPADLPAWPVEIGSVVVPAPGEEACGDAWQAKLIGRSVRVLVADGLGHGVEAADASTQAAGVFLESTAGLNELVEAIHNALRHTRGAAVAVSEIDLAERMVRFVGVGNISAVIVAPEREYNMVSHNGTVGHEVRKIHQFTYPWPEDSLLIMHSDGLSRRWDLRSYPGLVSRHPTLIAGVLYRDFKRGRDDAAVMVAREVRGAYP